ncbi:MAG: phage tail assembly protein [Gammaproteobacteria bacterium]|nr:phage tail assembly protein [Gammaproteobacteria bacterium]
MSKKVDDKAVENDREILLDMDLRKPVTVAGKEITHIIIREPTVDDLDVMGDIESSNRIVIIKALIAHLLGWAPSDLKKAHVKDVMRMVGAVGEYVMG